MITHETTHRIVLVFSADALRRRIEFILHTRSADSVNTINRLLAHLHSIGEISELTFARGEEGPLTSIEFFDTRDQRVGFYSQEGSTREVQFFGLIV